MRGVPPITSYAVVMYAAMLHAIEGVIVWSTHSADGCIPIAGLLDKIPNRALLVGALLGSAIMGASTLYRRRSPTATVLLLAPQQVLLLITGIAAWLAVWHAGYADGVIRGAAFITADQLPRGLFSLIHLTSIVALATYHAPARKNR